MSVWLDPSLRDDPYPWHDTLRATARVSWDAERGVWIVTGHNAIVVALRDPCFRAERLGDVDTLRGPA